MTVKIILKNLTAKISNVKRLCWALLSKSARAAVEHEHAVNCRHECTSKIEVSDDQLDRLQHGTEGARLLAHLAGQGHVLAWQCQRQAGPQSEIQRGGDRVLPDDQELLQSALRQAMGMAQSLLNFAGLDWRIPDFSTVSRRQKNLSVTIGVRPTTTGLHLLVDSTGIKMLGEGEWKTKEHGADYRRQWRKVRLGIDASTLEIRAIEVTDNATGDVPTLPCLLEQIPAEESIACVSGDGAYDMKDCHEAIAQRGAQAIIPTRKDGIPWKDPRPGVQARNAIPAATRRLGRKIWKKWSGCHRHSLVETKMRCFKLLGGRVMARDFDRQLTELQVHASILNRFTRLGTPTTIAVIML